MVFQPGAALAAILYGTSLAVVLVIPLDRHDLTTHGFLIIPRYDSTWRMAKDLALNLVAFAPFGFLLRRALRRFEASRAAFVVPLMMTLAFALTVESLQSAVPGRYPALLDVVVDVVGAALGAYGQRPPSAASCQPSAFPLR